MNSRWRHVPGTAIAIAAAITIAFPVSSGAADRSASVSQSASSSSPTVTVEEPSEDISEKIVSSASNYYALSKKDDIDKAPKLLKAAEPVKETETETETETQDSKKKKNKSDSSASSSASYVPVDEDSDLVVDMTEEEIYMFECEVYCEAGDESLESQIGVAQVILNRIRSSQFPDNLADVLYQEGQFPPATNGFMDRVMASGEGTACHKAVMQALHGADVIGDYLYFNMTSGVDFSQVTSFKTIDQTTFYSIAE